MTMELVARFEKHYCRGPRIQADLRQAADTFSITVLVGPSGCGKTTVLRCLAGLERPQAGVIRLGEEIWFDADRRICLSPQQRTIGYLFQEYALFPHLTVAENIGYGLNRAPGSRRRGQIGDMLDRFGLNGLEQRWPHQVSGGQQQRIALARVLVRRPRLLLLDEPLSALDTSLREELRSELRRLLAEFGIPVLMVTHDRMETTALADQVLVLDDGAIRQAGSVQEVFTRPADLSVARIVGVETLEPARVLAVEAGLATIAVGPVTLTAQAPRDLGHEAYVCIRAEEVALRRGRTGSRRRPNHLEAQVRSLVRQGPMIRVDLDCGFALAALVTRSACEELGLRTGDVVTAWLEIPAIHLIPRA